ncbi:MAG TPA: phospho-N-acetylmuramoyl-pentapeptide-transferase [Patescibacteria group bacterium]|nr:phospho-N-acetylmuramoyl-pentapeptide-transferase [Patescibacteria group bacterium]
MNLAIIPLGMLLLSFFVTSILIIPFIDLLYRIKFRRQKQHTKDIFEKRTPIFDKLHGWKVGTPVGGGLLVICVVTFMALWAYGLLGIRADVWKLGLLLFTFLSFGALGLLDDARKFFFAKTTQFWGLRFRHKMLIQLILSAIIALWLYGKLGYDFINIQWIGPVSIGIFFIPFVMFVVVAFANAFNITDGLDGLSTGVLVICLFAFWVLALGVFRDDPTLAVFIGIWVGSLMAFLYFNVYPARIWLGDVGALSFGATLAVVGLLSGKIVALPIIGGVFVVEVASSLLQLLWKRYAGKKLFPVAPLHLLLQHKNWEEPKIVMRMWLAGIMFAILGLWLGLMQ